MDVDAAANRVVVGPSELLARRGLVADRVNWIPLRPRGPFEADVRIRYRAGEAPAVVEPLGDDRARVEFRTPVRAVAPGQLAAFYAGDEVLGAGTIDATF